ncbi:MAG TPA: hypothetical protein PL045_06795, partial [Chitinophagaceae bacterium]|nr:hypothetical protein [Chitinophagaceae bacterium]
TGIVTIIKAKTIPQYLFACIPLVFAIQQFAEGMLWLALRHTGYEWGESFFTYTFLFFAIVVWPVWVPLTIRMMERNAERRKIMMYLLCTGVVVSVGTGYVLLSNPVHAVSGINHIHYSFNMDMDTKYIQTIFALLYSIATLISPFISTVKRMKWFGYVLVASSVFAVTFYNGFVISVWCYFAAVLSVIILWIIAGARNSIRNNVN